MTLQTDLLRKDQRECTFLKRRVDGPVALDRNTAPLRLVNDDVGHCGFNGLLVTLPRASAGETSGGQPRAEDRERTCFSAQRRLRLVVGEAL